jgi:hypothetical protein
MVLNPDYYSLFEKRVREIDDLNPIFLPRPMGTPS